MGSHGVPMASMENPRMSEIVDFNENHYPVRQKIGEPGSISIRNVFPLHPVTSKPLESPYGAKYFFWAENQLFQFFALLAPYRGPIEALLGQHNKHICEGQRRTLGNDRGWAV